MTMPEILDELKRLKEDTLCDVENADEWTAVEELRLQASHLSMAISLLTLLDPKGINHNFRK